MSEPFLYSISDCAASLAVSTDTIRRLIARGDLCSVRIGARVLIPADAVRALVDEPR